MNRQFNFSDNKRGFENVFQGLMAVSTGPLKIINIFCFHKLLFGYYCPITNPGSLQPA